MSDPPPPYPGVSDLASAQPPPYPGVLDRAENPEFITGKYKHKHLPPQQNYPHSNRANHHLNRTSQHDNTTTHHPDTTSEHDNTTTHHPNRTAHLSNQPYPQGTFSHKTH